MQKKNLPTNEVGTTTEMNLACAKLAGTFQMACWLFRQLEYANGRGTGEHQFDLLEKHFEKVNGQDCGCPTPCGILNV